MTEKIGKRRSWGKAKRREDITIINREGMEDILQKIDEEDKEKIKITEIDLQYPELMSNEVLTKALKRIKVPIPVYPDGSPSRERLLYLYKLNVLPRPQRSGWVGRRSEKGRLKRSREGNDCAPMEVDQDHILSSENKDAEKQRKRQRSNSDETEDSISPTKRLSLDQLSTGTESNILQAPPINHSPSTNTPKPRVVQLKRPILHVSTQSIVSGLTKTTIRSPSIMDSCNEVGMTSTKKMNHQKITWP